MKVIENDAEYDDIWDKLKFEPLHKKWLTLPFAYKRYRLSGGCCWSEEQERLVNSVFKKICPAALYALDWQHDCFIFSPAEDIPLGYWYYDEYRDCNVYFPSYFPDGDFHFFISADLKTGLFGHPWKMELYVMGDELIKEFDCIKERLDITELQHSTFPGDLTGHFPYLCRRK